MSVPRWSTDGRLKESTIAPHVCENLPQMSAGVPSPLVSSDQSHDSLSARNGASVTMWLFSLKPAANAVRKSFAHFSPSAREIFGIFVGLSVAAMVGWVREKSAEEARRASSAAVATPINQALKRRECER